MSQVGRLARASLAGSALFLAVLSPPAFAQTPNMTGEALESNPVLGPGHETTFGPTTCDKDGNTTITFEASGSASGPYNGTFTESGTVTIGPQTDLVTDARGAGPVIGFEATFTIESVLPPATITGTKSLVPDAPTDPAAGAGFGRCDPDGSSPPQDVFVNVTNNFATYEAQIDAPTGSRTDSGNTSFSLVSMPVPPATFNFLEIFNSSEVPPPPTGCDDDDGQGGDDQGEDCDEDGQGEDGP